MLVSGFVSLTLTPMLCSRFLQPAEKEATAGFTTPSSGSSMPGSRAYDWSLKRVLRHRFVTLLVSFAVIGLTYYLFHASQRPASSPMKIRVSSSPSRKRSRESLSAT